MSKWMIMGYMLMFHQGDDERIFWLGSKSGRAKVRACQTFDAVYELADDWGLTQYCDFGMDDEAPAPEPATFTIDGATFDDRGNGFWHIRHDEADLPDAIYRPGRGKRDSIILAERGYRVKVWGDDELTGSTFSLNGVECTLAGPKRGGYEARISSEQWHKILGQ